MATYLGRIQLLATPASEWQLNDAVLLTGEIGASNVGSMLPILKIGDGVRPWSQLPNLMAPVDAANDYVAGPTTTLPPGSAATVTIDNTVDPPTISFGIPRGNTGPPNSLAIGVVTTGAPGTPAAASITGAAPNQTLNLVLPQGQQGPQGIQGPIGNTGPANTLAIGDVTTGAPGSAADASITGAAPNQTLNLVLPQGQQGPQGIQGPPGNAGTVLADDSHVTGDWMFDPTAFFGFTTAEVAQLKSLPGNIWSNDGQDAIHAEARLYVDRIGAAPSFVLTNVATSYGAPTMTQAGATLGAIYFQGTRSAALGATPGAYITATALENWTDASTPGRINLVVIPSGATGGSTVATFGAAVSEFYNQVRFKTGTWHADSDGANRFHFSAAGSSYNSSPNGAHYWRNGAGEDVAILSGVGAGDRYLMLSGLATSSNVFLNLFRAGWADWRIGMMGSASMSFLVGGVTRAQIVAASGRYVSDGGVADLNAARRLDWNLGTYTYGAAYISGVVNGYTGLTLNDGGVNLTLMSNGAAAGMFLQGESKWLFYRETGGAAAQSGFTINAPGFNVTSSRKLKRETGKPSGVAYILERLRPILYRLLEDGDAAREQLGLIAEEVHEICPHLSDGKTVSYDRLALLLLADWQESRERSFNVR